MKYKNLIDLLDNFKDDQSCYDYIEKIISNGKPFCVFCSNDKVYTCKKEGIRQIYKCSICNKKFHCLINTFFENTKFSLRKWFACMYLLASSSKGISSVQLARQAGITQKTARTILHKIRNSFSNGYKLFGDIEIDETYIGGKEAKQAY